MDLFCLIRFFWEFYIFGSVWVFILAIIFFFGVSEIPCIKKVELLQILYQNPTIFNETSQSFPINPNYLSKRIQFNGFNPSSKTRNIQSSIYVGRESKQRTTQDRIIVKSCQRKIKVSKGPHKITILVKSCQRKSI